MRTLAVATALLLALEFAGASAARADQDDPPTRAARLSYIQGSVSLQPAGTQDWVAPPVNRPLTTGDQLWVDPGGRAELQLPASVLRVGPTTSLALLNLGDQITQVQLASGTLIVHVRHLYEQETYEVDTPNLAFTVLQPGTYRIEVDPNAGTTTIDVRHGQSEASGGGTAYSLYEGENDVFSGTEPLTETAGYPSPPPDELDAWSDGRDERWEHSLSARYVSPDVVGYEDLDDQGAWMATPEYGYAWFPRELPPGWAPYQIGHWAYVPPWGYTWIDDRPWGFAPFHYGRWIWREGAWGWVPAPPPVPGVVYVRPVYAPALVAWIGAGAAIAWFALGPREVFVPSYPCSRNYVNTVNISNTTVNTTVVNNIYNTTIINKTVTNVTYVNRGVPGAIVATTARAFTSAAPIARNRVPVAPDALAAAPVRALAPALVPSRQAVLGSGRAVSARPPSSVLARPVVARTAPPPPPPSFEQHQKALQANGGRPLSAAQVREMQPAAAQVAAAAHVRVAPPVRTLITPKPAQTAARPVPPAQPPAHPAASVSRPPVAAAHPPVHIAETPPPPRPPPPGEAHSVLERQQLQEQQRLQVQQEAERRRVQQQQEAEHQRLAAAQADAARRQQQQAELERQHQLQTQQLQQRLALERQQLQERQQQQRAQQQVRPAPPRSAPPSTAPPKRPPQEKPGR